MPRRRVLITGIGPISAFGLGIDPLWSALNEGRSAIGRIQAFDPSGFACQVAGELPGDAFRVRDVVPKSYRKSLKVMCRDVELAVGAAAAAVADAMLVTKGTDPDAEPTIDPSRLGCHIGAGLISADVTELTGALVSSRAEDGSVDLDHWGRAGMENLTPLWLLKYLPNMLACHVTIVHECRGPSNTITCCEASSGLSLGESTRTIERGAADACLTGGAEHKINLMSFQRQVFAGRLIEGDEHTARCRPFDPAASGTVLGEGGGLIVVEDAESAARRGARVYAEVVGYAATQSFCPDTIGLTPAADDPSLGDCLDLALRDAGLAPADIDAIVPFGSGIPSVDRAEEHAITTVFGDRAAALPLVTTIPFTGNCNAGNGAIQISVAAKCLLEQRLPARLNTTAATRLDANETTARDASLRHVAVMTSSQGGQNAAVILRARGGRVMFDRRVVVTGMGWITPLGHDLETVWGRLVAGESGVRHIDRFEAATFPTTFAAQVRDYDFRAYLDDPDVHANAGMHSRFALGAARQAWNMSGLSDAPTDPRRMGIYLGAGEGALDFANFARTNLAGWDPEAGEIDARAWAEGALKHLVPSREIEQEPNMPASHLAREFGLRGPVYNCLTACAASTQAIGEASTVIRRGDADVMVSGGTHTMIHVLGVTGFNRLTALSNRNEDPPKAPRPFDRTRDGFVMGEGSGVVILEALEHAEARGAVPIAEIAGYGSSADAFRITDMHPEGRGPATAISLALEQAGIDPAALGDDGRPHVHYISAHGTGTQENDSIETLAVKRVFGANAPAIPMSSIKSMMGHLIAAAGAVELITCIMAMRHGMIPPTINLNDPDPDLDLDYVPNVARRSDVRTCLSNSFGFGGQNDTLIVRTLQTS